MGAIVISPTDPGGQEAVVGSVQRVVEARARAPRDAAVQHYLEYLGSEHPDFELEGSTRSVVWFGGVLPGAAPCVACAPVDLDGQVGVVDGVPLGENTDKVEEPALSLEESSERTASMFRESCSRWCVCRK